MCNFVETNKPESIKVRIDGPCRQQRATWKAPKIGCSQTEVEETSYYSFTLSFVLCDRKSIEFFSLF